MGLRDEETDCRKCCVDDFKNALCKKDFCEKYYREGSAEVFEKLLPHWIPCSERLPEDIIPVIVTWKITDTASYYRYFTGTACHKNGKWYWYSSTTEDMLAEYGRCDSEEFDEAIECVAWMPLPEPYQEGKNDRYGKLL